MEYKALSPPSPSCSHTLAVPLQLQHNGLRQLWNTVGPLLPQGLVLALPLTCNVPSQGPNSFLFKCHLLRQALATFLFPSYRSTLILLFYFLFLLCFSHLKSYTILSVHLIFWLLLSLLVYSNISFMRIGILGHWFTAVPPWPRQSLARSTY